MTERSLRNYRRASSGPRKRRAQARRGPPGFWFPLSRALVIRGTKYQLLPSIIALSGYTVKVLPYEQSTE